MQLNVTLHGEPISAGDFVVVAERRTLFVGTEGVAPALLASRPWIDCRVGDKEAPGRQVLPEESENTSDRSHQGTKLAPPGVVFDIPEAPFWNPKPVELTLGFGKENSSRFRFHIVSSTNPAIRFASSCILLVAGVYLTLALPSFSRDFEDLSRVGLGGVTLAALFVPTLRRWIDSLLHRNLWALSLAAIFAVVAGFVGSCSHVILNRTAETIELLEAGKSDGDRLEPGHWVTTFTAKRPKGHGYCDLARPQADNHCEPMHEMTDLPLLLRLFRKEVYGCSMNQLPAVQGSAPTGNKDMLDAWKNSKLCRPPLLQWKTNELAHAVQLSTSPGPAIHDLTVVCNPRPGIGSGPVGQEAVYCKLPSTGKERDGVIRQFHPLTDRDSGTVALRLTGNGMIKQVLTGDLPGLGRAILPLPQKADWVVADVEIAERMIGQSLLYPSRQKETCNGSNCDPKECWFLKSGEHLEKLVIRGTNPKDIASFTATDQSTVSTIPMCWHASDLKNSNSEKGKVAEVCGDGDRPCAVEVYLDENWSPRDGWGIELPGSWAPRDVRLYKSRGGYWGTATQPTDPNRASEPQEKATESSGKATEVVSIALHRIGNAENMPKGSLKVLQFTDARDRLAWDSRLDDPEWFWAISIEKKGGYAGPYRFTSKSHPNVSVNYEKGSYRGTNSPMKCYFRPDTTEISSAQCIELAGELPRALFRGVPKLPHRGVKDKDHPEKDDPEQKKWQEWSDYAKRSNCKEIYVCEKKMGG